MPKKARHVMTWEKGTAPSTMARRSFLKAGLLPPAVLLTMKDDMMRETAADDAVYARFMLAQSVSSCMLFIGNIEINPSTTLY